MEFTELAKLRRSAVNFHEDVEISVSELEEIFEIVKPILHLIICKRRIIMLPGQRKRKHR